MIRQLAKGDRRLLLQVARESATARVTGRSASTTSGPVLARDVGAFVSIRVSGTLRGCIGQVEGTGSLADIVAHAAAAAASEDPRFTPVRPDELPQIVIEVSVLGPLRPCPGPHAIEIGRHGLLVDDGRHRGLLLPQVAVEWEWDSPTFVSKVCVKAGLRPDAWTHGATLQMFEANVFSEADAG